MSVTEREQVGEVGGATVSPPTDVVDGAQVEPGVAARHRTAAVEGTQRPALVTVGEPRRPAEVERPGGADDHPIADHDLGQPGAGCAEHRTPACWLANRRSPGSQGRPEPSGSTEQSGSPPLPAGAGRKRSSRATSRANTRANRDAPERAAMTTNRSWPATSWSCSCGSRRRSASTSRSTCATEMSPRSRAARKVGNREVASTRRSARATDAIDPCTDAPSTNSNDDRPRDRNWPITCRRCASAHATRRSTAP